MQRSRISSNNSGPIIEGPGNPARSYGATAGGIYSALERAGHQPVFRPIDGHRSLHPGFRVSREIPAPGSRVITVAPPLSNCRPHPGCATLLYTTAEEPLCEVAFEWLRMWPRVVAKSEFAARLLQLNCHVASNGASPEWKPSPWPSGPAVFAVCGDSASGARRKNIMGAVMAFNRAFPDGTEAKLIVKHGEPLSWLPDGAEQLPGDVPEQELAAWFARAHFHVSTFRSEGYGLWQQQCMASARIPICPRFSAPVEFIPDIVPSIPFTLTGGGRHGNNGTWCEPDTRWLTGWMRAAAAHVASYERLASLMPGYVAGRTFDALAMKLLALVE